MTSQLINNMVVEMCTAQGFFKRNFPLLAKNIEKFVCAKESLFSLFPKNNFSVLMPWLLRPLFIFFSL